MACALLAALGLAAGPAHAAPAPAPAAPAALPAGSLDPRLIGAIDDLVAANRVLAKEGILPGYGHVSMRSPTNPQRILISRSLAPGLVGATDIVELDLDCNPTIPGGPPLYLERFIHCSIYKARPDINAVLHAHTTYAIAFSASGTPMKPVVRAARILGPNGPPIFDIHKIALHTNLLINTREFGDAMAKAMGKSNVVLMTGHGMSVGETSIVRLVRAAEAIEQNGVVLTALKAAGGPISYVNEDDYSDDLSRAVNGEAREWKAQKAEVMRAP
jgi:HCOMODA/2-hydroxy-3-carboxy-muconic semialdehyde decarboxylase